MSFLPDAELAQFRADVLNMLPDGGGIIQSYGTTPDGAGGFTEGWTPVTGGTVNYRLDPALSRRQVEVVGQAEGMIFDYILTVAHNAPLNEGNRFICNAGTVEIRQLWNVHSWNVSRRAYVSRVR